MIVSACQTSSNTSPSNRLPEPDAARAAELLPAELQQGRRLYEIKCARCHKFYNPADYDRAEWHSWMRKMSRKAHLSPDEERFLSRYLDLFRPKSTGAKTAGQ